MTYLILGAGGGLGHAFMKKLGETATGLTHSECDVSDPRAVQNALERVNPKVVINASGYTAVDKAEQEPELAFQVNAYGVQNLAVWCAAMNLPLITFSTDYVFSGEGEQPLTESDSPSPRSVYGRSKLAGEQFALAYRDSLVIRTSWLYSEHGKSFPRTILTRAKAGEPLKIVNDQTSAPTYSADLVDATLQFFKAGQRGLFHYSCSGETNWFDFASRAIQTYSTQINIPLKPPTAIKTSDLNLPAPRPRYSTLSSDRADSLGIWRRSWQEALDEFVSRARAAGTL